VLFATEIRNVNTVVFCVLTLRILVKDKCPFEGLIVFRLMTEFTVEEYSEC